MTTDTEARELVEWPREIWMAELDQYHNGTGMVVLSEFATIPRYEQDDERNCDFHRYIDADIYDSAEKYWRARAEKAEAENERLRRRLHRIAQPGRTIAYCQNGHEEAVLIARAALKGADDD